MTVNIEAEDPSLAERRRSRRRVSAPPPIIVERSQYRPDPAPQWHEAHNSFGVTATGTKWGLAEGRVGGSNNAQTYILLANPGTAPAQVEIRYLARERVPVIKNFTLCSQARVQRRRGADAVPALQTTNFGAVIYIDAADRGRARALLGRGRRHVGRGLERDRDPAAVQGPERDRHDATAGEKATRAL